MKFVKLPTPEGTHITVPATRVVSIKSVMWNGKNGNIEVMSVELEAGSERSLIHVAMPHDELVALLEGAT